MNKYDEKIKAIRKRYKLDEPNPLHDGSLYSIARVKGQYYKTLNEKGTPLRPITKSEYDRIMKNRVGRIRREGGNEFVYFN